MIPSVTQNAQVFATHQVTLLVHISMLSSVRSRLLDELERLTAAEVGCGNLGVRLSGAFLHGLHLELVGGTPAEVTTWMATATTILQEAARYVTPPQSRLYVVLAAQPPIPSVTVQGGAA